MEGFLSIYWCVFWFVACIPFLVVGMIKLRKMFRESPEKKMTVAISGAFIFVLSSLKLPSVTGSSSHPTGTGLSTILSGPWITAILSSIVLLFQALLLAHGGITTLGANIFSMGIVGPFVAYGFYKVMMKAKVHVIPTIFATAFVADFATYVTTSFQLALAYPSDGSVLISFSTFLGIFAITQVPLAMLEAILIVMFFDFLSNSRPELTRPELIFVKGKKVPWVSRIIVGAIVAGCIAAVPFLMYEGQELRGTDNKGGDLIQQIDPEYNPWFKSLFTPSESLEPWLFKLQGAIGIAVIVAVLYIAWRKSKKAKGHRAEGAGRADDHAKGRGIKNWPPLGKFLLTLSLLVVALTTDSLFIPLMTLSIGLALLLSSTGARLPRSMALLLLDSLAVILVGCIVIAFLTNGGGAVASFDVFGLDITLDRDGMNLATLVLLRSLAGMTLMLAFMASTSVPHFAMALRQLHVPKELLELTVLIYRYSFLLLEQLETMTIAASSRLGFKGMRTSVRTTSKLAVGLFSRSITMAERSQVALSCRNYKGDFPVFRAPKHLTWPWVAGPLILAFMIYYADHFLEAAITLSW